jgi:hypothetical protein
MNSYEIYAEQHQKNARARRRERRAKHTDNIAGYNSNERRDRLQHVESSLFTILRLSILEKGLTH